MTPAMKGRILILGAGGRLGFAAALAFRDAGWSVTSMVRPGRIGIAARGTEIVEVVTRDQAIEAGEGCDVVLNALNPALTLWDRDALAHGHAGIAVAEANGATLLYPGNLFIYGPDMPPVIDETTPANPASRKGAMRVQIENYIEDAVDRGMRAIILRAGDFFGSGTGSWLDLALTKDIRRRIITYPGPLDLPHTWAYLPDLTATMVGLAERRAGFSAFETFGFAGHAPTGHELIEAMERATGLTLYPRAMHWRLLKTFGRLFKTGRELVELEYLWTTPHRISENKLAGVLGMVPHTPLAQALEASMRTLYPGLYRKNRKR